MEDMDTTRMSRGTDQYRYLYSSVERRESKEEARHASSNAREHHGARIIPPLFFMTFHVPRRSTCRVHVHVPRVLTTVPFSHRNLLFIKIKLIILNSLLLPR